MIQGSKIRIDSALFPFNVISHKFVVNISSFYRIAEEPFHQGRKQAEDM
jgi:hypothetical protein